MAQPPQIPDLPHIDVSRERITARIYAYRLLAAASDALTTGEPPQWPDPPPDTPTSSPQSGPLWAHWDEAHCRKATRFRRHKATPPEQ